MISSWHFSCFLIKRFMDLRRLRIPTIGNENLNKIFILFLLGLLVISTISIGIYYKHYFVVLVFGVWLGIEALLYQLKKNFHRPKDVLFLKHFKRLKYILSALKVADPENESKIAASIMKLPYRTEDTKTINELKNLVKLRELSFGKGKTGEKNLLYFFLNKKLDTINIAFPNSFSITDISEASSILSTLYWHLYEIAANPSNELSKIAREIYFLIFDETFEINKSKINIENITDSLQRDGGLSYLILNLLKFKRFNDSKKLSQLLLTKELKIGDELRSTLYWLNEIYWFINDSSISIKDFQTTIRYLYHLCFTNPDRAGFLEIDSQFFPEFDTVNEIAREGFLFKETLIDELIILWKNFENSFNPIFSTVLKVLTNEKNKIYDSPYMYEKFWNKEKENFSKEYLLTIEGNLYYFYNQFEEARELYERSISISPLLRSANLNLLFCYAKLGDTINHERLIEHLMTNFDNEPTLISAIGNSFLLMNNEEKSEEFYSQLPHSWKIKSDYYRSTFCYNQGLFEKALYYAKRAFELNPNDSATNYHLSLCFSAVGEKKSALDVLNVACHKMILAKEEQWLKYYRFTLERDVGLHQQAISTLLKISPDYFDDPEELENLIKYAKDHKNLQLVKKLLNTRKKN